MNVKAACNENLAFYFISITSPRSKSLTRYSGTTTRRFRRRLHHRLELPIFLTVCILKAGRGNKKLVIRVQSFFCFNQLGIEDPTLPLSSPIKNPRHRNGKYQRIEMQYSRNIHWLYRAGVPFIVIHTTTGDQKFNYLFDTQDVPKIPVDATHEVLKHATQML